MNYKRMYIHKHNSFKGHVAMSSAQMREIMMSKSVTTKAADLAQEIYLKLGVLNKLLNERVDYD